MSFNNIKAETQTIGNLFQQGIISSFEAQRKMKTLYQSHSRLIKNTSELESVTCLSSQINSQVNLDFPKEIEKIHKLWTIGLLSAADALQKMKNFPEQLSDKPEYIKLKCQLEDEIQDVSDSEHGKSICEVKCQEPSIASDSLPALFKYFHQLINRLSVADKNKKFIDIIDNMDDIKKAHSKIIEKARKDKKINFANKLLKQAKDIYKKSDGEKEKIKILKAWSKRKVAMHYISKKLKQPIGDINLCDLMRDLETLKDSIVLKREEVDLHQILNQVGLSGIKIMKADMDKMKADMDKLLSSLEQDTETNNILSLDHLDWLSRQMEQLNASLKRLNSFLAEIQKPAFLDDIKTLKQKEAILYDTVRRSAVSEIEKIKLEMNDIVSQFKTNSLSLFKAIDNLRQLKSSVIYVLKNSLFSDFLKEEEKSFDHIIKNMATAGVKKIAKGGYGGNENQESTKELINWMNKLSPRSSFPLFQQAQTMLHFKMLEELNEKLRKGKGNNIGEDIKTYKEVRKYKFETMQLKAKANLLYNEIDANIFDKLLDDHVIASRDNKQKTMTVLEIQMVNFLKCVAEHGTIKQIQKIKEKLNNTVVDKSFKGAFYTSGSRQLKKYYQDQELFIITYKARIALLRKKSCWYKTACDKISQKLDKSLINNDINGNVKTLIETYRDVSNNFYFASDTQKAWHKILIDAMRKATDYNDNLLIANIYQMYNNCNEHSMKTTIVDILVNLIKRCAKNDRNYKAICNTIVQKESNTKYQHSIVVLSKTSFFGSKTDKKIRKHFKDHFILDDNINHKLAIKN